MQEQSIAISEQELTAQIEDNRSAFQRITRQYQRGMLLAAERDRLFAAQLYLGFFRFLDHKQLRIRVREKNWDRFLADRALWQSGAEPVPFPGCPWLLRDPEEASALDKIRVFRLMESLLYPPAYFKPIPETCAAPQIVQKGYGTHTLGMIYFRLRDDDGLFRAADPVGKTFTLTDSHGLRAVLTISSARTEPERDSGNRISPRFSASGTVEGYTTARERTIRFSDPNEAGWLCLEVVIENEDLQASRDFPLWAEYHALERERQALADEQLRKLTAQYGG